MSLARCDRFLGCIHSLLCDSNVPSFMYIIIIGFVYLSFYVLLHTYKLVRVLAVKLLTLNIFLAIGPLAVVQTSLVVRHIYCDTNPLSFYEICRPNLAFLPFL